MRSLASELMLRFTQHGLVAEAFSISGFLFAVLLIARMMSEKKAPANTVAWLLVISLVPYLGVPLYLLFGGRKLRRLAGRKMRVQPKLRASATQPSQFHDSPVAHTVASAGGGTPVAGNKIHFLTTGEATFAALEKEICAAKHNIHITTFILGRDATGKRLVNLLAERAAAGVKVRLLLDAVGCLFSSRSFVDPIRNAGGEVGRFMPVLPFTSRGSANLRSHRKIAIFDHARAIIGGHNLAHEYMGPTRYRKRWNDFGAMIEGPAAALLNEVFIADWCFTTRQVPETLYAEIPATVGAAKGNSELLVVASGPDVPGDPLYEGIVSMIQEATESIWVVTPYFIPDDVLLRSLIVKARSGKEVTLIMPERSNHPVTDLASRHYVRQLRAAGAHILLYSHGMMHSKAVIVDDRMALLGSANFDLRSLFVNFEIGVLALSPDDAVEMKKWAKDLARHCREPKAEKKKRFRIFGNLLEDLSRLLAPLL